ncbi:MAG: fatty acid desaturase family protein [Bacteroidota bacterium]
MSPSIATKYLSPQERKMLTQKNDWRAAFEVLHTWTWIAATFATVYLFPHPLVILVALFIMGGRQLACSIIMHDAGHFALFTNKKVNDFVGKWLGSYMIMNDMLKYRTYHLQHHLTTGTVEDPDISLTKGYPTTVASMLRKIGRDLAGATGIKSQLGLISMHLGYLKYSLSRDIQRLSQQERTWASFFQAALRNLAGPITAQLILLTILTIFASPWLYLLWIGALLTTFNFSIRIRSMAEHAMVADTEDSLRNTRTTYANWWERILFAPHYVNYHVEHHLLMSVPPYNLPQMHRLLRERGFYKEGLLENGYWEIIKMAVGKKAIIGQ